MPSKKRHERVVKEKKIHYRGTPFMISTFTFGENEKADFLSLAGSFITQTPARERQARSLPPRNVNKHTEP